MTQLARGEPLSPAYLNRNALIAFLFGLHNAVGTVGHLMAQHMHLPPTDDEFVGMADYVTESFHDLLQEIRSRSPTLTPVGGAITPHVNVSWQRPSVRKPPRDMSTVSTRGTSLLRLTSMTRARGRMMQGSRLTHGWIS
jgi:hypothetical protein